MRVKSLVATVMLSLGLVGCGPMLDSGNFAPSVAAQPSLGDPRDATPEYRAFVESLWPEASRRGVSRATFDAAFAGVTPDQRVLDSASRQAEFVKPLWQYVDDATSDVRIMRGQEMLAQHSSLLDQIEARYGVSRYVVVAIWGMESSYGRTFENPDSVRDTIRSLVTLAYQGGRRAGYGREQLMAALHILERGDVAPRGMIGSWAGAMGHTQFIPTTYEAYAVDFDGDGRRNIWTSIPDALGSTANYLREAGWRSGQTWGYEVVLPAGFDRSRSGQDRSIGSWRELGVARTGGQAFPRDSDEARLWVTPDGGPAFLTLRNFRVIKRYNNADSYALGVGHLADRLAGAPYFTNTWPERTPPLNEAERMEVQRLLMQRGYPLETVDGRIGPATQAQIAAFQRSVGLPADGRASPALLDRLRGG
jgi:membrane-bound lytic murein transglycosylase B